MHRKEFSKKEVRDASKLSVGIVVARFNQDVTDALLAGAREVLHEWGVREKKIATLAVSGSFELPFGCQALIKKKRPDAVIALGCIVKGETEHDRHIAQAVSMGLTRVSLDHGVPVAFGVLTVQTLKQAKVRSSGETNHGKHAAIAALSAALDAKAL